MDKTVLCFRLHSTSPPTMDGEWKMKFFSKALPETRFTSAECAFKLCHVARDSSSAAGPLPPELGDLVALECLDVRCNRLRGELLRTHGVPHNQVSDENPPSCG